MTDQFDLATLYRPGGRLRSATKRERHTHDFLVNGVSLFATTRGAQFDLCGCFSDSRFEGKLARRLNGELAKLFTFDSPAEIPGGRVALFVCPECGDLACGAITVQISRSNDVVKWADFAYEDGSQTDFSSLLNVGPFEFDLDAYKNAIGKAAS